jgi:hypothetical protein
MLSQFTFYCLTCRVVMAMSCMQNIPVNLSLISVLYKYHASVNKWPPILCVSFYRIQCWNSTNHLDELQIATLARSLQPYNQLQWIFFVLKDLHRWCTLKKWELKLSTNQLQLVNKWSSKRLYCKCIIMVNFLGLIVIFWNFKHDATIRF